MVIDSDDDDDDEPYEHCVNSIDARCMKWNRCANVPTNIHVCMWMRYISFIAILQDSMIICTPHLYSTNDSNINNITSSNLAYYYFIKTINISS